MTTTAPPAPPPPDAALASPPPEPAAPSPAPDVTPPDRTSWVGWDDVADVVGLGGLGLLAVSGLGPAFGGSRYLVVAGVGLLLGLGLALLAAGRRLPLWGLGLAVVVVEVVVGAWLIDPGTAVVPTVPSGGSTSDLLFGAFRGWANLLTTTVPVGAAQNLLVVPWASALVVGAASMSISRRAGARAWALLALVPLLALLVAGILMGIDEPAWTHQATAFTLLALVWGSYRQRTARSAGLARGRRPRLLSSVALLAGAGALGLAVGQSALVTGSEPRFVLRDHVDPPVDLRQLPSPLEGFRRFRTDDRRDELLFTVEGLRAGDRLRLATLDHYDGTIWHVQGGSTAATSSGFFQRVGQEVPVTETGERRRLTVEVGEYDGAWLPNLGATAQVEFSGDRASDLSEGFRYNTATDTAAEPAGLRPGDRYELEVIVPDVRLDLEDGNPDPTVAVPDPAPVDTVGDRLGDLVESAGPGASPLRRVRAVEAWLRSEGDVDRPADRAYFSDGELDLRQGADPPPPASRPGHSAERMRTLLDDVGHVVGNEEQFASAMALLADQLGMPARVVVGFAPEVSAGGRTAIRGSDISAWTEVAVDGVGWIPLFPTPVDREIPTEDNPEPIPPPDRYVVPPPVTVSKIPLPSSGGGGSASPCREDCGDGAAALGFLPGWAVTTAKIAFPPVLLVGGATAIMAALKARRRRRRRTLGDPAARVAAGWTEVCDLARDLGDVVPERATRRETAVLLTRPGVADLARTADALVFGPDDLPADVVAAYWREADTTRAAMVGPLSLFVRWKALVSPTSLRRRGDARSSASLRARLARLGRRLPRPTLGRRQVVTP